MPSIVFLITLKEGADRDEFDAFVRDAELPLARGFPSTVTYKVIRVDGFIEGREGKPSFDYVAVAEVSDAAEYEKDVAAAMQTPEGEEFEEHWLATVAEWTPVHGTFIE